MEIVLSCRKIFESLPHRQTSAEPKEPGIEANQV
jgi:hypothetical protein